MSHNRAGFIPMTYKDYCIHDSQSIIHNDNYCWGWFIDIDHLESKFNNKPNLFCSKVKHINKLHTIPSISSLVSMNSDEELFFGPLDDYKIEKQKSYYKIFPFKLNIVGLLFVTFICFIVIL